MMQDSKRKKLKTAGWQIGSSDDFLGLAPDEVAYIEMKLALSQFLRERRLSKKLSQVELARILRSSQSRVAKMEAGDPSVSMDLIMKSLLVMGASPKDLARTITSKTSHMA